MELSLSSRPILRQLAAARLLDEQSALLKTMPPSFLGELGADLAAGIAMGKELAARRAQGLAREGLKSRLAELNQHMADGNEIVREMLVREGNMFTRLARADVLTPVISQDNEHVVWPFDGEYWRDEPGTYRQIVISLCQEGL